MRSLSVDHVEQAGLMDSWKDIVVVEGNWVDHRPADILTVADHMHSEDSDFHNQGKHVASGDLQLVVVDTVQVGHTSAAVMLENWVALVGSFLVEVLLEVPVEAQRSGTAILAEVQFQK